MMELSAAAGFQREGTVKALGRRCGAGHSEAARESRDGSSPLCRMEMSGSPRGNHQGGTVEVMLSPLNRMQALCPVRGVLFCKEVWNV